MKINYILSEKLEFFQSLLTMNGYWNNLAIKFFKQELSSSPYKSEVILFFSKHRTDKVFSSLGTICNHVLDFSKMISFPFYFDIINKNFLLNKNSDISLPMFEDSFCIENLLQEMESLYKKCDFHTFFSKLSDANLYCDNSVKKEISVNINSLLDYIELDFSEINIYISPLILGNFSIPSYTDSVNIVISPSCYNQKYIWNNIANTIVHEILHNIINKKTSDYQSKILNKISKEMNSVPKYYDDFQTRFNELIIRSIVIRIQSMNNKIDNTDELIKIEENHGFTNIKEIYEQVIQAEDTTKKKLDLDKLYNEIAK